MENRFDARGWLREAKEALETARRLWEWQRWVALCQAAQLCIEYSARAVIACFAEPQWTHDPSEQLLPLLQE
ncbi:MAG TPA: HEPN domain-containing protein [Armatimonadetes bacterium]|nr:HEPN domain-containing protein [Armatimonadota bacterium]